MSCPAQDGGLSKSIKYYILCLAYARSGGDALSGRNVVNVPSVRLYPSSEAIYNVVESGWIF